MSPLYFHSPSPRHHIHPLIHLIPLHPSILTTHIPLSYSHAPYFPLSFFLPHPLPSPPFYPPHTLLRHICFVTPSNKGTQKRRRNEQGTKEERTKCGLGGDFGEGKNAEGKKEESGRERDEGKQKNSLQVDISSEKKISVYLPRFRTESQKGQYCRRYSCGVMPAVFLNRRLKYE